MIIDTLGRDLTFAWRTMRRSPGVTAAAIVALALGIGANTAIFSVVDGVLLRPLPYHAPSELVRVFANYGTGSSTLSAASYPEFKDVRDSTHTLAGVAAFAGGDTNLSGRGGPPERVRALLVTQSFVPTLGVQPVLGRNFLPEEDVRGHAAVVILDYGLWQTRYAGDPGLLGQSISLDGEPFVVVGIMPRGFAFRPADLYLPLATSLENADERSSVWLGMVARRSPGVSEQQLDADLAALSARLRQSFPNNYTPELNWSLSAVPLVENVTGNVRLMLLVLLGAVAFVLLIACANVANLLLARTAARHKEMAVRIALGARRGQIIRQLLTESALLGISGGALGLGLAVWGVDLLVAASGDGLPRAAEIHVDARVLAFTVGVSLLTSFLFGLMPALTASRPDVHAAIKDGTRGSSAGHGRLRKALVVAEVALSLVLLVGAGLMARSFVRLRNVDPGFKSDHLLSLRIALPTPLAGETDRDHDRYASFFTRTQARLSALPGVRSAGGATILPFARSAEVLDFTIEGYTPPSKQITMDANIREVTPGYFETMGIQLDAGRIFSTSDGAEAPPVVLVNAAFVRRFWPGGGVDPVGKRLTLGGKRPEWRTIVGVVGDMHSYGLASEPVAELYFPHAQLRRSSALSMVLRTEGDPRLLAAAARAAIAEIDPTQPIYEVRTLDDILASTLAQRRLTLSLMLLFGAIALLLAAVGIYGVMSYTVAQRTQEIGIRMALGARPGTVLTMVLRDGMTLVAVGLAVGAGAALALGRVVSSLLYGTSATDAPTFAVIAAALALVALAALVIPARRATRVDPMQALRSE